MPIMQLDSYTYLFFSLLVILFLEIFVADLPQLEFDVILVLVQGNSIDSFVVCTYYIFCLNATNVQATYFRDFDIYQISGSLFLSLSLYEHLF